MTTITLEKNIDIQRNFKDLQDLYLYMMNNQLVTEVWYIDEDDLTLSSKILLKQSKTSPQLINI